MIDVIKNTAQALLGSGQRGLLIASLVAAMPVLAHTEAIPTKPNCFANVTIEPGFVAFTTHKKSTLDQWYRRVFNLKTIKEFSFPDGSVDGLLMRRDEFVVEVFKRDDVLQGKTLKPKAKPSQWAGVKKVGIYSNAKLDTLKLCLLQQGVQAGRIYDDKNLGIRLLHVTDPESNNLEIISRM